MKPIFTHMACLIQPNYGASTQIWWFANYLGQGDNLGADLLATLRQDPDFVTTPIIVCSTAHAHLRASAGWWDQSGVSIVSKPFDIDDLLGAIQQALAAPAAMPAVSEYQGGALPAGSLATARSQCAPARGMLPYPLPAGLVAGRPGSARRRAP